MRIKQFIVSLLSLMLVGCATDLAHLMNSGSRTRPAAASTAGDSTGLPTIDLAYKKYVLPNGLTLIVHEDHASPVAALDVWYHVGSKDEEDGKHGYAHLFEHLLFNGNQHRDDDYSPPLQAAGNNDVDPAASYDRTNFFETVPTSALDLALWQEAQNMGGLSGGGGHDLDQSRLDQQRSAVENEKRQRDNSAYGKVNEIIARSTYPPGHPYSWTPLGSVPDLDAATLADVRDWAGQYYGAANATLVVSGDVKAEDIKTKVESYFGDIPGGAPVGHVTEWTARMSGDRRGTVVEDVPQARVYLVWNLPPAFDADTTRIKLAAAVLTNGQDSRLYKLLVHDDPLATDVSATVNEREIGSQLVIRADARPGVSLEKIEQTIDTGLAKLLANGPQAAELDRVRVSLFADFARRLQAVSGQAEWLARSQLYGGSPDAYKRSLSDLRDATPEEVRDSLRNWLTGGGFVLDVQPSGSPHVSPKAAERGQSPQLGAPSALNLPPLQRTTLSNGMQVLLAPSSGAQLVDFDMLFAGGRASNGELPGGTAALTFDLLSAGTAQDDALAVDGKLQGLGASFDTSIGPDGGDVRLSALKSRLRGSLDLYAALICRPAFPASEIARHKRRLLASIDQQKASANGVIRRVLPPLLYGAGHPYGTAGLGSSDQVKRVQRDDIVAYAKRWLRPDNATLLVTGDIDMATLKPLLEARFGSWKASTVPVTQINVPMAPMPTAPRVFLIDQPYATQSVIVAATLAPPPSDAAQPAFDVVGAALGGDSASRLDTYLRDVKHWSSGAFSGEISARHQQIFYSGAAVQTDKTTASLSEIRSQIDAVASGVRPWTDAEVRAAKQWEVRSLPGAGQTLGDVTARYRHILAQGLPDDFYNRLVGNVEALTTAQVQTATQQLIQPQALTWVIVGDLSKIEQPVRELNLGAVQVIDADGKPQR